MPASPDVEGWRGMSDAELRQTIEGIIDTITEPLEGELDVELVFSTLRKINECSGSGENDLYFLRTAAGGDRLSQAMYGLLPEGFTEWDLADDTGWSVAHTAVMFGHLPKDFDRWDIANEDGWTVAHEAAYRGKLPSDFDYPRWKNLVTKDGETVLDIAKIHGHEPKTKLKMKAEVAGL